MSAGGLAFLTMDTAERRTAPYLPYTLLILTSLFWSGNGIAGRLATTGGIDPLGLTFWRWAGALLFLIPFALPHLIAERALVFKHWRVLTAFGALAVSAFTPIFYYALSLSTAINITLVAATIPAVIVGLSWLLFRETISWRALVGMVVAVAGVIAIIARGDIGVLSRLEFNLGDIIALGAVLTWALYSVLLRYRPRDLHPMSFLIGLVIPGVVLNLAILLIAPARVAFTPTWGNLAVVAYVALFPSVIAYFFFNAGVKAIGANRAGQFGYLVPLFAAVLAVVILGESFEIYHLVGMIVIFIGLYLASRRRA